MADSDPHTNLAPDWEAVEGEDPRGTYWWNVSTNETTWEKPVAIVAKKGIAAGYLAKVQSQTGPPSDARQSAPKSGAAAELAALREAKRGSADAVSDLSWRVGNMATPSGGGAGGGPASPAAATPAAAPAAAAGTPTSPASASSVSPGSLRSQALSAEQMKKFVEAKAQMKAKAASLDTPPEKVDLYK